MLSKHNEKEKELRALRASSKARYTLKKVANGVASVLVGFTLSGAILPTASVFVHAEETTNDSEERIVVENFQLTHIGDNDGVFSHRVGAQIQLQINDDLSDGDTVALDIYQDSDAYAAGDVDQVRRFNVDTDTQVIVNDGENNIVVGTYDGQEITFNAAIEDLDDVSLTVHIGSIVEPSYVYYYETVEESYTDVVSRPIRTVYDANMSVDDEPEILVEGSDGERTIIEEVTYRLGEEVDGTRTVISNEVTTNPQEQVVAVGVQSQDGAIEIPEDPLADLEVGESNPDLADELYQEDGLSEAELIEAYNARGVNHTYHVHVDGELMSTTAIGFTTPSSMEIRNERAQDTEDVTATYNITDSGRVSTALTFADVFSVASEQDDFDGSETLRVELRAADGQYFSQRQAVNGHILELTDAAYETEDGVVGSDVIVEPEANRLQTDARVAELDVNLRYVDSRTLIADVALGDVSVADLGDRLLVLDGIQSTATTESDDYSADYRDVLATLDENVTVRAAYGTEADGFSNLMTVTAPASDQVVGYVYDSVNIAGTAVLAEDTVEVVSESYEEAVPFESVTVEDDTLLEGETEVDVEGADGLVEVTENVTYVNGEETERVEVSRNVLSEPVMRVVRVGTAQADTEPIDEDDDDDAGELPVVIDPEDLPDEETPVDEEDTTPVDEEDTTPVDEEETTPVGEEEETPVNEEDETPVDEESATPVDEEDATPVNEDDATPVVNEENATPVVSGETSDSVDVMEVRDPTSDNADDQLIVGVNPEDDTIESITTPDGEDVDANALTDDEREAIRDDVAEQRAAEALPVTATALPMVLVGGVAVLVVGGVLAFYNKKKQSSVK